LAKGQIIAVVMQDPPGTVGGLDLKGFGQGQVSKGVKYDYQPSGWGKFGQLGRHKIGDSFG
jgi:hypothetical protein